MAYDMYDDDGRPVNPPKKADVILRYEREISGKTDDISDRARVSLARIEQLLDEVDQVHKDNAAIARQNGEIYSAVSEDIETLRSELKFLALQNESIYSRLTEKLVQLEEQMQNVKAGEGAPIVTAEGEIDYDKLADKLAERLPEGRTVEGDMTHLTVELDYNNLARRVAERLANGGEAIDYDALADKVAARMPAGNGGAIDYDVLVDKMVARLPMQDNYSAAPVAVASIDGQTLDYDVLADKLAERLPAQEAVATATVDAADLDLDALARKVASYVPRQGAVANISDVNLDCDELADKVVSRMPMYDTISPDYIASKVAEQLVIPDIKAQADIDLDELADKVAARMPKSKSIFGDGTRLTVELDYDMLADKVAERIPGVTTDEDGNPVRVVRETTGASIDYEVLAEKISNYLPYGEALVESENVSLDYDLLADKVAERIPSAQTVATAANVEIDEEDLADRIALKVGAIRAEDFDVLVDDDGCQTITKGITENLDYEYIANTVAEKLRPQLELEDETEPDYEEMAQRISEKITVAGINEDAIADKAAQALSNYLPEIDADDIADKVASQVISAMPELTVDTDYISTTVSEKIMEMQADHDYDIVLDEDGLKTITEQVTESVSQKAEERFNNLDGEIADLKAMIEEGVAVRETETVDYSEMAQRISENITVAGVDEDAIAQKAAAVLSEYVYDTDEIAEKVADKVVAALPAEKSEEEYNIVLDENGINEVTEKVTESVTAGTEERFDAIDREIAEIKEILETRPAVVISEAAPAQAYEEVVEEDEEEQLVTVSDLIAEEETEQVEEVAEEPVVEEVVEQPVEEVAEPEDDNDEEDGEEGDEETLEEFSYDELAGEGEGGVDFANMMRYNRSFIARIIQSTDDQKAYYGEVRNALLSYKKVNSNIAWGAERFHKGRETIARFKIRGKTLVLYLALDPSEHEFSVYHHKDVSNNRSVAGTPMMIKIKSPRGVKKAVRLIDEMLEARGGIKRNVPERDYAAMYPYETMEELIEDGLVKDVRKDK